LRSELSSSLALAPFVGLVVLLPYPGTVAARLLLLVLSLAVAVRWYLRTPRQGRVLPPGKWALLSWILVAVASLAYTVDVRYSLGEIKNEILYAMAAFLSFFVAAREDRRAATIVRGLAAGIVLIGVVALYNWLRNGLVWPDSGLQGGTGSFSAYLVTVMPAVFWLTQEEATSRCRRLAWVLMAFTLTLAFITLQRAVWPALVVQLLIAVWFLRSTGRLPMTRRRLAATVVAVCAIGAFALIKSNQLRGMKDIEHLVPSAQSLDTPIAQQNGTDGDVRISYWPAVLRRIADHPLAGSGFGLGTLKMAYPDLVPPNFTALWHAHNVELNYAVQMGLPGALAILALFAGFANHFRRSLRGDPAAAAAAVAGLMLLAGVLVRNQTNDFFRRDLALMFWCVLGMFAALSIRKESAP